MRIAEIIVRKVDETLARPLDQFVREVRTVLNGGVRLREQMAGEVKADVRYVGGGSVTVQTKLTATPLAVLCLRATVATTGAPTVISGGRVTWSYSAGNDGKGYVEITGIDGLTASTDYLVTLAIVEG